MKCARPSCPLPGGPSGFCDMHAHEELNLLRANPTRALLPEELAPIGKCPDECKCSTTIGLAHRVRSLQLINERLLARQERPGRHANTPAVAQRAAAIRPMTSAPSRGSNGRPLVRLESPARQAIVPPLAQRKPPARSSTESNLWEAFVALGNGGAA